MIIAAYQQSRTVQFNIAAVLGKLDIGTPTMAEKQSIEFVFRYESDPEHLDNPGEAERQLAVTNLTTNKIHDRYALFRKYARSFPLTELSDHSDALSIALICDDYTIEINNTRMAPTRIIPANDYEDVFRDDGFTSEHIVLLAQDIFAQATDIQLGSFYYDEGAPHAESVFLAHVFALENVLRVDGSFFGYEEELLVDMISNDIRTIKKFAGPSTDIGRDLLKAADKLEDRILDYLIEYYEPHIDSSLKNGWDTETLKPPEA